ncbi:TonB-dependent siderophore receptor [Aquipseudomonas ullengensis]|uniref:TonB-dependent siderophore receptor n=1 Tax=Aquipseudomonas ullengensis TaxID=2759166 RepID=A0A7W4Q958_9GAMM|nr:TonB-dependent siderophore receptor [Pseudomonas ullengensis]MBB2494339.1 TonB-dependent siderophore receptor [Pseudomonas ullengensis]
MSRPTAPRSALLLRSPVPSPLSKAIHRALLGAALALPLGGVLLAEPAWAQSVAAERDFAIAAGSLESALNSFAATAGVSVSFSPDAVRGRQSAGLHGRYGVDQALNQLLAGSGVQVVRQASGNYSLLPPPEAGSALQLDATSVTSTGLGATTEGTGSYTSGSTSTATGLPLSIRETPQSVSVITSQRMRDQGLTQLTDVVRQTPGLTLSQSGGNGGDNSAIYSRGFAVENYQIDGLQLLDSNYSSPAQSNDMVLYDRVEVIRGATGLTNGVGTPGATLNMIRKRPTADFKSSVSVTGGSWDYRRTEADVSGSLTESGNVRGRLVGAYQENDSYVDRLSERKEVLYGVIEADLTPDTLLTFGMDSQSDDYDGHARSGLPLFNNDGSWADHDDSDSAAADWAYSNRSAVSAFAILEHNLTERWKAKLTLNNRRSEYDEFSGYAGGNNYAAGADPASVMLYANRWKAKPVQNSFDLNLAGSYDLFGREHDATIGYTQQKTDYNTPAYSWWRDPVTGAFPVIGNINTWDGKTPGKPDLQAYGRMDFSEEQDAAYASTRLRATDDLSFILGARLIDWENKVTYDYDDGTPSDVSDRSETGVVTPFAGVVYDLNDIWSVYGSYTSIFKPQSYKTLTGAYIDPLEGVGYEVGSKAAFFDDRLNLGIALYQIEQDNLAVSLGDGQLAPDGSQAYRAESGTKTRGFEVELTGEVATDWQVSTSFSRNIVQDSDGNALNTNIAQNTAKLFTSYTLRSLGNGLTFGGGVNWQSEAYSDGVGPLGVRFTQDDYAVVDAFARYPLTKQLSATLNLNNLLDEEYYTTTTSSYFGTPRNATLGLRMDF